MGITGSRIILQTQNIKNTVSLQTKNIQNTEQKQTKNTDHGLIFVSFHIVAIQGDFFIIYFPVQHGVCLNTANDCK